MENKKDLIFKALQPLIFVEPVKGLGGATIRFQELSGSARDALYDSLKENAGNSAFEAALIAATVVDDEGAPLFNEKDIDTLRTGRKALLEELSQIAMRMNGLGAQAQEQAVKN